VRPLLAAGARVWSQAEQLVVLVVLEQVLEIRNKSFVSA
jgi:hypothetical protein